MKTQTKSSKGGGHKQFLATVPCLFWAWWWATLCNFLPFWQGLTLSMGLGAEKKSWFEMGPPPSPTVGQLHPPSAQSQGHDLVKCGHVYLLCFWFYVSFSVPCGPLPHQAFSDYQLQQMTSNFIDQFGFNADEFTEQEERDEWVAKAMLPW